MRFLPFMFILLSINLCYSQKYFTDISITSGARYNQPFSYENFSNFQNESRIEHNKYYSFLHAWNPFIAVQSSVFEYILKNQKKGRSLSLKLEGGLFFHQVKRDYEFFHMYIKNKETDSIQSYILDYDEIVSYTTKSNNLGVSLNVVFVKKWSQIFDFEYGLIYKSDFSFLQNISFDNLPADDSWRELEYSNSHYLKNRFNHEIYLYLGVLFNINKRLSVGLTIEQPTLLYSRYVFNSYYPIVGTENNFTNRNLFLGLKCAYRLK